MTHEQATPHCAGCQYWDTTENGEPSQRFGAERICRKPALHFDATDWVSTTDSSPLRADQPEKQLRPDYEHDLMFVQDASDYQAHLITLPQFYCAHFVAGPYNPALRRPYCS